MLFLILYPVTVKSIPISIGTTPKTPTCFQNKPENSIPAKTNIIPT